MKEFPVDRLADAVLEAFAEFDDGLHDRGRKPFPRKAFDALFQRVLEYVEAVKKRRLVHRSVASELNGFREYLQLKSFRTPGDILYQADRLECIFFSGHDPHFEGDEPPGL